MEKEKTTSHTQLRFIGPIYLYNMLQDFRHLLVFDFRTNFPEKYIRDSFNVVPGITKEEIFEVIDLAEGKANEKEQKYKTIQKVRRYFFVAGEKVQPDSQGLQFVLKCLDERKNKEDKFYGLTEGFQSFATLYPFMLLSQQKLKEAAQKGKAVYDKEFLYPYAKFPSEIVPSKLYLGTVYSSNSAKQLNDLAIVSLVDFIDYSQQQKVAEFKLTHESYHHWPINKDIPVVIDFDLINKQIDELVTKGKVLLYCKDGESISPAFAISYLMYKAKLDVTTATLKVCQAISRVELNKMVYTQLLLYKPKK